MSDLERELEAEALRYQAEAHAADVKDAAKVAEFVEGTAPEPVEPSPADKQKLEAEKLAKVAQAMLPKITLAAWVFADKFIQGQVGAHAAATPAELNDLSEATIPLVEKYLPGGLAFLFTTPEGALLMTAAVVYGPKVMAGPPPPPAKAPEAAAA